MKLQPLNFKEFGDGMEVQQGGTSRILVPIPKPVVVEPPPPPPPVFTEEDLRNAQRDSYQKGFLDGIQEGRKQAENQQAETDRNLVALLENFVGAIAPLYRDYRQMVTQLRADVPQIGLAIAQKVAGQALNENAHLIITDVASRCCEAMIDEAHLTITVHESMADTMEHKLREMAGKLPDATHITILRSPDMPLTDVHIAWENGFMERLTAGLWQRVETAVKNIGSAAVHQSNNLMEELKAELPVADPSPDHQQE